MSELSGSEFGRGSEVGGAGDGQKEGGRQAGAEYLPSPTKGLSGKAIRAIQGYPEGEGPENDQGKQ